MVRLFESARLRNNLEILAVGAVFILAAFLRLHNVADNPAWYTDVATHIDIAKNLLLGRTQYLGINQSILLFGRMPLFEYALSALFRVFGTDINTLRSFTGILGTSSVVLLYAVVRATTQRRVFSVLAAFAMALYPQAVLYSRFGFSYNLLQPLIIVLIYTLWKYRQDMEKRWLVFSAMIVGIGGISDLAMYSLIPAVLLLIVRRRIHHAIAAIFLIMLPFLIFSIVMLLSSPSAFLFDLQYTVSRMSGSATITYQISQLFNNYVTLINQDIWMIVGISGMVMFQIQEIRIVLLVLFFIPFAVMGRTVALYHLSFYYMIPLLPLVAIGSASFLLTTLSRGYALLVETVAALLKREIATQAFAAMFICLLIGIPIGQSLLTTVSSVSGDYLTSIDAFLIDPQDSSAVANYLTDYANNSIVIATSPVAWQLNTHVADFQMMTAYVGYDAVHIPGNLPVSRFTANFDFRTADAVVVDNLWKNWGAIHIPFVADALTEIVSWPILFQSGELTVYGNPDA